ncbi:MAG: SAM-dependent methyltransferase, partial [Candidatus Paceibacterales bacterium]
MLEKYSGKVKWVSSLTKLNTIQGCILSNELLDAFPVHLVEMEEELKEVYVNIQNGSFYEMRARPRTSELGGYLTEFSISLPKGYRTEIN